MVYLFIASIIWQITKKWVQVSLAIFLFFSDLSFFSTTLRLIFSYSNGVRIFKSDTAFVCLVESPIFKYEKQQLIRVFRPERYPWNHLAHQVYFRLCAIISTWFNWFLKHLGRVKHGFCKGYHVEALLWADSIQSSYLLPRQRIIIGTFLHLENNGVERNCYL